MNRVPPLSNAAFALMCCAGAVSGVSAADAPVLAQELANVRASGKVMTALWTARGDSYTLQLVFPYQFVPPKSQTTRFAFSETALDPAQVARVQVWLLKADGTQVFSAHGSPPPGPKGVNDSRTISYSINYSFPLEASKEAVAAVVQINDNFYIDRLKPLRE
ncbi:MAG: hypothetical protein ABI645_04635 [Pseudomonadota bacterium]